MTEQTKRRGNGEAVVCPSHKVTLTLLGEGEINGVEVTYWGGCTGTIPGQTCRWPRDHPYDVLPSYLTCRCRETAPCTREVRVDKAPGEQGDLFGGWHEQRSQAVSMARRP